MFACIPTRPISLALSSQCIRESAPEREAEEGAFQRLPQRRAKVQVRLECVRELGQQVGALERYLQARLSWAYTGKVSAVIAVQTSRQSCLNWPAESEVGVSQAATRS